MRVDDDAEQQDLDFVVTGSETVRARSRRQASIGLLLASAVILGWAGVHVMCMFFYTWGPHSWITAPILMAVNCWLYVGLFIVAHDCMHGSLVPFRPAWNRRIGQLCLMLYAGFDYDHLNRKHHLHHRHSGLADDPDFDERPPHSLAAWYLRFLVEYFSWREALFLVTVAAVYTFILDVHLANLLVLWALPAIVSSFQLFYFGTYLPHRPGSEPFRDRHRARSNHFGWWLSLITCFHFGYHHEHHRKPDAPWWALPGLRDPDNSARREAAPPPPQV